VTFRKTAAAVTQERNGARHPMQRGRKLRKTSKSVDPLLEKKRIDIILLDENEVAEPRQTMPNRENLSRKLHTRTAHECPIFCEHQEYRRLSFLTVVWSRLYPNEHPAKFVPLSVLSCNIQMPRILEFETTNRLLVYRKVIVDSFHSLSCSRPCSN
jgi:hypothetical protein